MVSVCTKCFLSWIYPFSSSLARWAWTEAVDFNKIQKLMDEFYYDFLRKHSDKNYDINYFLFLYSLFFKYVFKFIDIKEI